MSGIMKFLFWWDVEGLSLCHKNYITAIMNPMDSTGKGSSHCAPRPKHPPSPLYDVIMEYLLTLFLILLLYNLLLVLVEL